MKRIITLSLICFLVVAAAYASGTKQETSNSSSPAEIDYWHTMSDPETEQLKSAIQAFEEQHPQIRVSTTKFAYDDFKTALLTGIAGGEAPDTARMDIIWVPEFAERGALMQLDGNVEGFGDLIDSTFPGPRSTTFWKGHYYGVPQNTNTQVLLWHEERFNEAGLSGPPQTMEQFAQYARTLSDASNERYGFALGGTYFWAPAPIFYAMGGRVVDEETTTASGYINGAESVRAFRLLVDLYNDGALSPNVLGGGIGTADGHGSGRYAMIIDGPWMVDIYADTYPDFDVSFAPVPNGPDGTTSSVVGGEDAVIFQGTDQPEAAKSWIKYLLSEEFQRTMAQVGVIPTRQSLVDDESMPDYFDVFLQQLETAKARVPHPKWSEMDSAINNAFQRMLRGDQSVKQALDQAAGEINALLEE